MQHPGSARRGWRDCNPSVANGRAFPGEQISAAVYIHGVPANKLDVQPAMQKVGQTTARALPRGLRSAAN